MATLAAVEQENLDLVDVAEQYLYALQSDIDVDGEMAEMDKKFASHEDMISNIFQSHRKLHEHLIQNAKEVHQQVCKNMGSTSAVPFVKTRLMTRKSSENIAARTEDVIFMKKDALDIIVKKKKPAVVETGRNRAGSRSASKVTRKTSISHKKSGSN